MTDKHATLSTIGYEAAELGDFLATLRAAAVNTIIDIRQLAISRRPGFAKKALSSALDRVGIKYVHLRGLGDPKEGRLAARSGDFVRFRSIFNAHMMTDTAKSDLQIASRLIVDDGSCLLCFERDHTCCHRSIVAAAVSGMTGATIRHLGVRTGLGKRDQSFIKRINAEARP